MSAIVVFGGRRPGADVREWQMSGHTDKSGGVKRSQQVASRANAGAGAVIRSDGGRRHRRLRRGLVGRDDRY